VQRWGIFEQVASISEKGKGGMYRREKKEEKKAFAKTTDRH
jgi:stalled ribosome alternative rescue factor ArfA